MTYRRQSGKRTLIVDLDRDCIKCGEIRAYRMRSSIDVIDAHKVMIDLNSPQAVANHPHIWSLIERTHASIVKRARVVAVQKGIVDAEP